MKLLKFNLLLLAIFATWSLSNAQEIMLYPDGYIEKDNSPMMSDSIALFPDTNILLVREVRDPSITVFKAKGERKNKTIVVAPGGGFYILSVENEGSKVCEQLCRSFTTHSLLVN